MSLRPTLAALLLLVPVPNLTAQSHRNYEASPVHPIRISPDGTRLFVVHPPAGYVSVYSLQNPSHPTLIRDIPVGLEPISVTPVDADRAFIVNQHSDSVSLVSVNAGRVLATLQTSDEPADVALSANHVFVSCTTADEVLVFDRQTLAQVARIPLFGKDPRALLMRPDETKLYALIARSGNGTTILPEDQAPTPPNPTNPALPSPPQVGLIIRADDPAWQGSIPYTVPDHDLIEIDVATFTVQRSFPGVGTNLFDLVFDARDEALLISNTEARNLVNFEPNLKAHSIFSRVTHLALLGSPPVTTYDLNPGIDYTLFPNPAAKSSALAEPTGLAFDETRRELYVAATGTDRIGVFDVDQGQVQARIEVGGTPGTQASPRTKRGPRGLALLESAQRLYVWNRISLTLSVLDTGSRSLLREIALTHDPTETHVREGRGFLYDAKLSANGNHVVRSLPRRRRPRRTGLEPRRPRRAAGSRSTSALPLQPGDHVVPSHEGPDDDPDAQRLAWARNRFTGAATARTSWPSSAVSVTCSANPSRTRT